jgi:hypothetical protein
LSTLTRTLLVRIQLVIGLAVFMAGALHVVAYLHENATWLNAHGLFLGRPVVAAQTAEDMLYGDDRVVDEFSVDGGPASLCRWTDVYANALPSLARVRAVARARHWRPGTRVRLKVDPADAARCRPAYGWAEFIRLDLTGYVFLFLLFTGGALYVRMGPDT